MPLVVLDNPRAAEVAKIASDYSDHAFRAAAAAAILAAVIRVGYAGTLAGEAHAARATDAAAAAHAISVDAAAAATRAFILVFTADVSVGDVASQATLAAAIRAFNDDFNRATEANAAAGVCATEADAADTRAKNAKADATRAAIAFDTYSGGVIAVAGNAARLANMADIAARNAAAAATRAKEAAGYAYAVAAASHAILADSAYTVTRIVNAIAVTEVEGGVRSGVT